MQPSYNHQCGLDLMWGTVAAETVRFMQANTAALLMLIVHCPGRLQRALLATGFVFYDRP